MKTIIGVMLGNLIVFTCIILPYGWAQAVVYTNDNFSTATHEQPVYFTGDREQGFWGYTSSGKEFTQTPVTNDLNVRLHRFSIDEAFYYVSDRGIIWAPNDITALSQYLSRVS